jgi:hypothetical protein
MHEFAAGTYLMRISLADGRLETSRVVRGDELID